MIGFHGMRMRRRNPVNLGQALRLAVAAVMLPLASGCRTWLPATQPAMKPAAPSSDAAAEIRRHADESKQAAAEVTFPPTR